MPNINGNGKVKLEHRVTTLEVDNMYVKNDMEYVKLQVSNHIPTQINDIDKKLDKFISTNRKQFISILVSIILMLLGIMFSFLK